MAFFDIYRYLNQAAPMGRAAIVSADVSDEKRAESDRYLREHGFVDQAAPSSCWYCGQPDAARVLGLVLQQGVAVQHRTHMTLCLPSCEACRQAFVARARTASLAHNAGFVAALLGVIVLLVMFGEAPRDWIMAILFGLLVTLFIAGVVGSALGWIAVRASAGKTSRLKSELDYPPVKKAREEGWRPL